MDNSSNNRFGNKYSSYLPSIAMVFYMILLASSVAGQKLFSVFGLVISAGNVIFQISYMLVICITELYGLNQAKKIIITGAFCNLFVSYYLYLVVNFWLNQDSFSKVTLITSSILFTSTIAYVVSEIANATIVSKLQFFLKSKWFFIRALSASSVASILDTTFMLPVIISHSPEKIILVYSSLILVKIIYSFLLIPVLWILVEILKKKEPVFRNDTNVPFSSVSYIKNSSIYKLKITD